MTEPDPSTLIRQIALQSAGEILFDVILELEKWGGDPVVGKVRESIIQALRNRVFGPGFLA